MKRQQYRMECVPDCGFVIQGPDIAEVLEAALRHGMARHQEWPRMRQQIAGRVRRVEPQREEVREERAGEAAAMAAPT